ncbi:18449_t:CDS:1, partial [Acaulospora morrowiae]
LSGQAVCPLKSFLIPEWLTKPSLLSNQGSSPGLGQERLRETLHEG